MSLVFCAQSFVSFGTADLGTLFGTTSIGFTVPGVFVSYLVRYGFNLFGPYSVPFLLAAGVSLLGALAFLAVRIVQPDGDSTGIRQQPVRVLPRNDEWCRNSVCTDCVREFLDWMGRTGGVGPVGQLGSTGRTGGSDGFGRRSLDLSE